MARLYIYILLLSNNILWKCFSWCNRTIITRVIMQPIRHLSSLAFCQSDDSIILWHFTPCISWLRPQIQRQQYFDVLGAQTLSLKPQCVWLGDYKVCSAVHTLWGWVVCAKSMDCRIVYWEPHAAHRLVGFKTMQWTSLFRLKAFADIFCITW